MAVLILDTVSGCDDALDARKRSRNVVAWALGRTVFIARLGRRQRCIVRLSEML